MAEVIEDLIDGAESEVSSSGKTIVRAFRVYGLTPGTGIWQQTYDELNAQKGIDFGVSHPNDGTIYVTRIKPKPFPARSKTSVKVYVTYQTPGVDSFNRSETQISFHTVSRSTTTNYDADGDPIYVSYYPPTAQSGEGPGATLNHQLGNANKIESTGILEVSREEPDNPQGVLKLMNCINSQAWQGGQKGTWRCCDIAIQKIVSRPGFRVRYMFEYRQWGWLHTLVYTDGVFGVPADVQPKLSVGPTKSLAIALHNGYVNTYLDGFSDFNILNIPVFFS